jgi:aspartate/methionine/tyrosine aminotransferase
MDRRIPQAFKWAASYIPTPERPLLDMSQGSPGYPPPESLAKALGETSSSQGSFGYCPAAGELSLRTSLANEMKLVYGDSCTVGAADVALTAGCNLAFVSSIMCLADAGDEVILPVPWYAASH